MAFAPDMTERIARARADMRMGVPVVITDKGHGALVFAVESLEANRLSDARSLGHQLVLAITARRAQTLKARAYDGDIARIALPDDVDLTWVRDVADPSNDLNAPMKGPLVAQRDGDAALPRLGITLAKSARLLPSVICVDLPNPLAFAQENDLTVVPAKLAAPIIAETSPLASLVSARLPMVASEAGRLNVFRPEDGGEEHYAIEVGRPNRDEPVLVRLHSACFTGDVLGSLKCDCGPQLHGALHQMGTQGAGVLLYLNQEGRGIGLANKMRAYSLQDQGFDTVEANHRLGFEDDERDFKIGSEILKSMGITSVRLLTNNPKKIEMMKQNGIAVHERVALHVGENRFNQDYLATKAAKSGHLF